jgi:hypothetical protein
MAEAPPAFALVDAVHVTARGRSGRGHDPSQCGPWSNPARLASLSQANLPHGPRPVRKQAPARNGKALLHWLL